MKTSPVARSLSLLHRFLVFVLLGGTACQPFAAERDDYLAPPAARWGVLLLTNTTPAAIIATPSGYALAGITEQVATGRAGFLATVDGAGTLLNWAAYPHEPAPFAGFSVGDLVLTRDGAGVPDGYVLTGSVPKEYEDGLKRWDADSLWVLRTDPGLVKQWEYKGDDRYAHIGTAVIPQGTGYLIGAATWNGIWLAPPGDEYAYSGGEGQLTRLTATGVVEWTRGGFGFAPDLPAAPIWAMVAAGESRFLAGTRSGMALLDGEGDSIWAGGEALATVAVRATGDGGGMGVANRLENPFVENPFLIRKDIVLTRLEAAGQSVWTSTFGLTNSYDAASDLILTADGGCLILGKTGMYGEGHSGMWLIRTDAQGNNLWDVTLAGQGFAVVETPDHDFLVAGEAIVEGTRQLWLVKVRGDLQAPVPAFFYSPANALFVGDVVTFDATASTAPGSSLAPMEWDFGDGAQATGTVVRHAYSTPGTHRVRLTVTNREGIIRWTEQEVVVQAPTVQWERIFGDYWQDALFAMAPAEDGGFVLVGGTYTHGGQNGFRLWVLKLDARGRVLWERFLADSDDRGGCGTSIVPAPGGGHVIAGYRYTSLFQTYLDGWVLKIDDRGEVVWQRLFVGGSSDQIWSLAAMPGGGYAFTGRSESFCPTDGDVWWVRTDAEGLVTQTNIVSVARPYVRSGSWIAATPEGGTLLATAGPWLYENYGPFELTSGYFGVTKTRGDGTPEWTTLLGTSYGQSCPTWVAPTPDGGCYAAGGLNADLSLVRLDAAGAPMWTNSWGMDRRAEWGYGGTVTHDGGAVVVGAINWPPEGWSSDLMIARVNPAGQELWRQMYGRPGVSEAGKAVIELADGSLVVLGRRPLLSGNDYRPWLFKLGPNLTPTATFACTTREPFSGIPVRFAVTSAHDPDGVMARYEWDFGDGTLASGDPIEHTYASAGTYPVRLHAIDHSGGEGVSSLDLVVSASVVALREGVTVGDHEIIGAPGERPELVGSPGAPAGLDWEAALAFSLAATGPSGECRFRIRFPGPVPADATPYKLPDWTVVPYVRVDDITIEIELQIVGGELDPLFVLAGLVPAVAFDGVTLSDTGRLRLGFPTLAGREYAVQRTGFLIPAAWETALFATAATGAATNAVLIGTGSPATLYLEIPADAQGLYRLRHGPAGTR